MPSESSRSRLSSCERYIPIATFVVFILFVLICAVTVIPTLYHIEDNTSNIDENTNHLSTDGHIAELFNLLHEDVKELHSLLESAGSIMSKIEANTAISASVASTAAAAPHPGPHSGSAPKNGKS